jgi:hypothetical protein
VLVVTEKERRRKKPLNDFFLRDKPLNDILSPKNNNNNNNNNK